MAGDSLPTATDLSFLQISDSHIGFSKEADKDVTVTFRIALDRINVLPTPPSFLIHTGGITQLTKPEEFDTLTNSRRAAGQRMSFTGH
jgi:Icc protein